MTFRVHYSVSGAPKVRDVQADTADQAREIIKPKGSTESVIILKVKVLRA